MNSKIAAISILFTSAALSVFGGILTGPVTNAANGHAYYLLSNGTWNVAQAEAVRLGGNLVTINDAAEQDWVFNTFSATGTLRGLWIGLTDFGHEGNFTWISGESVAYRNWAPGEPNNGGPTADESFVHMWPLGNSGGIAAGTWNDLPGVTEYGNVILHGVVEVDPARRPANLIVNGSFETPALPISVGASHLPPDALFPWQTTDDSFEVWINEVEIRSLNGLQHLEILSHSAAVTVSQSVPTIPGEDYSLRFYHSPRPGVDSTLTVAIDSRIVATLTETGSALTGFKWQRFRTNFTAVTNITTIQFSDVSVDASGTHIDNVVLERLPLTSTIRVSEVEVCWETVSTRVYQVQFRSVITGNNWTDLLPPVQGNGQTNCIKDVVPVGEPQRFYRVITVP